MQVDGDGEADIDREIPDFNGQLRLMAVAFSDRAYGSVQRDLTVTAPIVTQLAMPRFVAFGDASSLALDVHNLSGERQQLALTVAANDTIELPPEMRAFTLEDGQKRTLLYPFKTRYRQAPARIELQLSGEAIRDFSRHWRLGVRAPYPAVANTVRGHIAPQGSTTLALADIDRLIPESFAARIRVDKITARSQRCRAQRAPAALPLRLS